MPASIRVSKPPDDMSIPTKKPNPVRNVFGGPSGKPSPSSHIIVRRMSRDDSGTVKGIVVSTSGLTKSLKGLGLDPFKNGDMMGFKRGLESSDCGMTTKVKPFQTEFKEMPGSPGSDPGAPTLRYVRIDGFVEIGIVEAMKPTY